MASSLVTHVGFNVGFDSKTGYYRTKCWYLLAGGRMQEVDFEELSWSELQDVTMMWLLDHRPGWAIGDGWTQPAIDFGDVDL